MAIDLTTQPIHLGRGGTARPVADFSWSAERLAAYDDETRADGPDGRMVMAFEATAAWTAWERHPAGDEVVVCTSGRHRFIQEVDGAEVVLELGPGEALVNPPGVWHTSDVIEPGWILTITPGQGTEHRPRSTS